MGQDTDKRRNYFLFLAGMGIVFGTVFNQVGVGLILGVTIAFILDSRNRVE